MNTEQKRLTVVLIGKNNRGTCANASSHARISCHASRFSSLHIAHPLMNYVHAAYAWYRGDADKDPSPSSSLTAACEAQLKILKERVSPKLLECTICQTVDKEARRLDCGHSPFCLDCLRKHYEPLREVRCVCTDVTSLQNRSITDLPLDSRRLKRIAWINSSRENSMMGSSYQSVESSDSSSIIFFRTSSVIEANSAQDTEDFVLLKSSCEVPIDHSLSLPFTLNSHTATHMINEWINSHWMLSFGLKSKISVESVTPVFLPVFAFSVESTVSYVVDIARSAPNNTELPPLAPTRSSSSSASSSLSNTNRFGWRTVEGKYARSHTELLQSATVSFNPLLLSEILRMKGAFSYGEMSVIGDDVRPFGDDRKEYKVQVEIDEEEAWKMQQRLLSRLEHEECVARMREQYGERNIRDVEIYVESGTPVVRLIHLPVFLAVYAIEEKSYEVIASGYRADKIVGDRPGMRELTRLPKRFVGSNLKDNGKQ